MEFQSPLKALNHLRLLAEHAALKAPWVSKFTLSHVNLTTKIYSGRKIQGKM